jgi:beta-glucanase (GH16 family)
VSQFGHTVARRRAGFRVGIAALAALLLGCWAVAGAQAATARGGKPAGCRTRHSRVHPRRHHGHTRGRVRRCAAKAARKAPVTPARIAAKAPTTGATTTTSTTTTSTSSDSVAPSCATEALAAKPGGGAWTCAFDDEFDASTGDATALNTSSWTPQISATSGFTTGPPGSTVCYVDSPNNISVSAGALHLTVRKEAAPLMCGQALTQYSGGMVSTYSSFDQTYGRFEVRALLPQTTVAGLQETLWLWPADDTHYGSWPDSGEVDFSEFYSQYPTLDVPYIHYEYDSSTTNATTNTNVPTSQCPISLTQYNDYAVVWSPGSFTITINGTPCLTDNYAADGGLSGPAPFDQPFFVILTQALGIGTNAFDPATTPLPATTSIDYVRVWK